MRLEQVSTNTKTALQSLFEQLQRDRKNLDTYNQNAVPQASLLLKQSQRGFKEGEIGYVEFVQGVNRALNIQSNQLDFINRYNQTLIKIEQLIKK